MSRSSSLTAVAAEAGHAPRAHPDPAHLQVSWYFVELPKARALPDMLVFETNCLCAFALNLAVFLLMGKTSVLTMNVAGVVKEYWLLIAFSWTVIKDVRWMALVDCSRLAYLGIYR
jgi:hypothetical protein